MGERLGFGAPSLKGRALRLLASREHSRAELERKLQAHETTPGELAQALDAALATGQPSFIEVLCKKGNRADLGRPDRTPLQNRHDFQAFLQAGRHA